MNFLLILKILFKLIVILLCLILFVIVSILFYPIRYKVKGKIDTENNYINVDGKVSWLYHILNAYFYAKKENKDDLDTEVYLKIFFYKKYFVSSQEKNVIKSESEVDSFEEQLNLNIQTTDDIKTISKSNEKSVFLDIAENEKNVVHEENEEHSDDRGYVVQAETEKHEEHKNHTETIEDKGVTKNNDEINVSYPKKIVTMLMKFFKKAKSLLIIRKTGLKKQKFKKKKQKKYSKIVGLYKKIVRLYNKIKAIYKDPNFKYTVLFLKVKVIALLKIIFPKRFKGTVEFSLDDPDKTAMITSFFVLFPVFYKKGGGNIYPDFKTNKKYVLADFELKGHFMLFNIIIILLQIWFDKKVMKLYHKIKRVKRA